MYTYALFALTTFLSAYLVFQIQPLIAKHLLPWYGGSAMVWVTALCFFTTILAVGYLYARWLTRLQHRTMLLVHSLCVLMVACLLWWQQVSWASAVTPPRELLSVITGLVPLSPVFEILVLLTVAVGLPLVVLSATSSLLQIWYARYAEREPVSLYSISNIGSLVGLLSYPTLIEPFFTTAVQGTLWFAVAVVVCSLLLMLAFLLVRQGSETDTPSGTSGVVNRRQFAIYAAVAAVPVFALVAGTSTLTTMVAPVPFLWVVPLALYLSSFIYSFQPYAKLGHYTNRLFVGLTLLIGLCLLIYPSASMWLLVGALCVVLFAIAHWCHEYLYRTRPEKEALPSFYLALSLGGIGATLLYTFVSVPLFAYPIELPLIMTGILLWLCGQILYELRQKSSLWLRVVSRGGVCLVVLLLVVSWYEVRTLAVTDTLRQERNFYGHTAVVEEWRDDVLVRSLRHGTTNHGNQPYDEGVLLPIATTYYGPTSGVGILLDSLTTPKQVLVAGLGVGSLAAYCRPGDTFTFLELDEVVYRIAVEDFTLLSSCPNAMVAIGDARQLMAALPASEHGSYEVVVIDTYADDMVPMHMLTEEAFRLYQSLITKDGYITVHVSSRYLDLAPMIARIADGLGMVTLERFDESMTKPYDSSSQWLILADRQSVHWRPLTTSFQYLAPDTAVRPWTDSYSALWSVVTW